ncbi:glycosyltransferase [Acetobacter suratthaniensis]|uniref:Glycosyltransferase n=1 Tax=Acetobacter suratthaniensis TaxID=1502841 RepID=A0ABS3LKJ2_9PROT|nr:glycosyltransferase [Acetobacter suratthaniensis]MBO1328132.1 glycosyltransferase [Acetobacter suratthaniensis]MCX2566252.1 glycosyltransferase [Acetobacter suratthaniensis]
MIDQNKENTPVAHTLQTLVMPGIHVDSDLYFRTNDRADYFLSDNVIRFRKGGTASTETYFNYLSLRVWRKYCGLKDISLVLQGHGRFEVSIGCHRAGYVHKWMSRTIITLASGEKEGDISHPDEARICIPLPENMTDGTLYFHIESLSSTGWISGGRYETTDQPRRPVKVGAVITHFNRQNYVLPALSRIQNELLSDPYYQDRFSIYIIDNSQNLPSSGTECATVIKNRNLGGSGGFARGLLEVTNTPGFTHCLFMDDDASCETDAFRRTIALLQFCEDEKMAVSGALMKEEQPWCMYEKGVRKTADGFAPMCHGMDMRRIEAVVISEAEDQHPAYGAWWFFAFPLNAVEEWPFPFFVRGDDMLFGLMNSFSIITINGVACWGEDFRFRESPMTRYLAVRSNLMIWLTTTELTGKEITQRIMKIWLRPAVSSRNYESAEVIELAMQHVMEGPDFWHRNIDMTDVRKLIGSMVDIEKMRPVDLGSHHFVSRKPRHQETRTRRLLRQISLNGLLLPKAALRKGVIYAEKGFAGDTAQIFGVDTVLYYNPHNKTGYYARMDTPRALQILKKFSDLSKKLESETENLRILYKKDVKQTTTKSYWEKNIHSYEASSVKS